MFKKFKLSAVVLALLTFSLMLFYQNCAQQSDDLGGTNTSTGGGDDDDNGGTGNTFRDSSCVQPRGGTANIFQLKLAGVGANSVITVAINGEGINGRPQLKVIPTTHILAGQTVRACPGGNNAAMGCGDTNFDVPCTTGITTVTKKYYECYGPWVRLDCPCLTAPTHQFQANAAINGYSSNAYDLSPYATAFASMQTYAKRNEVSSFNGNPALGAVNGTVASCTFQ